MDELLDALTNADFLFFLDDLEHKFQLELIDASYRDPKYTKEKEDG